MSFRQVCRQVNQTEQRYPNAQDHLEIALCTLTSMLTSFQDPLLRRLSDCEHINDSLIRRFPIPDDWERQRWAVLWNRLDASLQENAAPKIIHTKQGHKIEYHEMNAALCKPIIDEIDCALAEHYGFTDEELDFIINYDIKYRMGGAEGDDGEE